MGKTIVLAGTHYTVVGIFSDDGGAHEQRKIYVRSVPTLIRRNLRRSADHVHIG